MYPDPPYVLLIAGFLAAISSGFAFSTSLQNSVSEWNVKRSTRILASLRGPQLQIPFLGICAGVCVFLASGIQLFGFSGKGCLRHGNSPDGIQRPVGLVSIGQDFAID